MFSNPVDALCILAVVGMVGAGLSFLIFYYPRRALQLFVFGIILCEQYPMAFKSWTVFPELYNNLNVTLGIGALKFNPIELILGLIGFGAVLRIASQRCEYRFRYVHGLALLYAGWMLFSVVWGVVNHGNWKVALWILRPVIYFVGTMFLTEILLEKPSHGRRVAILIMIATTFKAGQIIIRHFSPDVPEHCEAFGAHECTSFQLWTLWFIFCGFFVGKKNPYPWYVWALVPILIIGVIFNERRINIATLAMGCMFLVAVQRPQDLHRRSRIMAMMVCAGVLYVIVGWFGPKTPITAPVKGFKEGIRAELMGENTDNSSFYRKVERYNLKHTIRKHPVLGTGLGVRYLQLIPLDDLGFEYAVYISHNQVLLVHSATGSVGYCIFLTFYCALICTATIQWRRLQTPWQRAAALAAALSMMNWMIVGYYDMQLFFFRNSIVMGVIVGLPAALERHQDNLMQSISEAIPLQSNS